MQRINSHMHVSNSQSRENSMLVANEYNSKYALKISQHSSFTVNSKTRIFKHNKRKSNYYLIGEAMYMSKDVGYEGNQLFSIYLDMDILGIAALKSSTEKDFEPYPELKLSCLGSLQCSIPVNQHEIIVCYKCIDTGTIWYRPHVEFFDEGRFIEQKKS